MGNWLKGRVLVIPDNGQQSEQVATNTSQNYQQPDLSSRPIYYPPYSSSLLQFATEEEQIQLAKRIGLIQHLPTGTYDTGGSSTKNLRECVICMVEFSKGDSIRFLPCLHTYHVHCIDDWLMRSFICPSCMEPVDVALLNTL
uniref:RING finger protein 11 n=1 Tax=Aceria tosichella TaxID=561515 RepID=A0A6G1S9H8_9ACAR